jgi:mannosyltransferase OCH1-like enzyme
MKFNATVLFWAVVAIIVIISVYVILCVTVFRPKTHCPTQLSTKQSVSNSAKQGASSSSSSGSNHTTETIPRILFKTGEVETCPAIIQAMHREFERANPGWEVVYMGAAKRREFLKLQFEPEVVAAYDALKPGAYKADLWRLCALYYSGGVYSDFSQMIRVPIKQLVDVRRDSLVLVAGAGAPFKPFDICNAFIGSRKQHPYIKACIDEIVQNVQNKFYGLNHGDITGPEMMVRLFHKFSSDPDFQYRMDCVWPGPPYIVKIDTDEPVIRHKHPDHYKLLGAPRNARTYVEQWLLRDVYKS